MQVQARRIGMGLVCFSLIIFGLLLWALALRVSRVETDAKEHTELVRRELKLSLEQLRMVSEKSMRERGVLWGNPLYCPSIDDMSYIITGKMSGNGCFTIISHDISAAELRKVMSAIKKPLLVGFQIDLHDGESCRTALDAVLSVFMHTTL